MNNNKNDEAALLAGCKGVFSKSSYVSFGQLEKPEEYVKKAMLRSVFNGKQFATAPAKEGATNDAYFEKKHNWIADGDKYVDKQRYKELQPDKKKGFLTSDFSKRDEFSNTIRTNQWREQLTQEDKYAKKGLELFTEGPGLTTVTFADRPSEPESYLYDLVFEKEDPHFSGSSKTHRDTKNRTMLSKDRAVGPNMTTHLLAFAPPVDFIKPEHARKPLIRDSFYRKTNILFPEGCAASTGAD